MPGQPLARLHRLNRQSMSRRGGADVPTEPMYGLSAADLRIQANAREFADRLVPFELDAEFGGGALSSDVTDKLRHEAIERGLYATNIPVSAGGGGGGRPPQAPWRGGGAR